LFVTWKTVINGYEPYLRGCVGTLEARDIINGFRDYALTSALKDQRFPPIHPRELSQLQCTVSVLTNYERSLNYLDWEVGKHGLIIEFLDPYRNKLLSGTYLPEVPVQSGWTREQAIDSLMRKAGYQGTIAEGLRRKIILTRYQSTLYTMHYNEYVSYVQLTRGSTPTLAKMTKKES